MATSSAAASGLDPGTLLWTSVVLLGASVVALAVSRRLGLGSVVGLLAVGIAIGPSGIALPGGHATLLQITELGVVLLMFLIGLEMQPRRLWAQRRLVFGLGSAQLAVTASLLTIAAIGMGMEWRAALVVGFGLAMSSTALVMQHLQERNEVGTPHGRAAFGVLLLQDLAIVPALAFLPLLAGRAAGEPLDLGAFATKLAAIAGVVVLARWLLPQGFALLARQRNATAFAGLTTLGVLLAAFLMHEVELSMALGAFITGMLLADTPWRAQLDADVQPFKGMLLGLFFIAVGMSVDVDAILSRPFATMADVAVLYAIKLGVVLGLSLAFGLARSTALRTAALLGQGGEFGFVLFAAAAASGLLDAQANGAAVLLVCVSMAATPLVARAGDVLARRMEAAPDHAHDDHRTDLAGHVILTGWGRVGRAVAALLDAAGVPWVALETHLPIVQAARAEGRTVIYGNGFDSRVLEAAGIGRAAAVVVAIDDPAGAERVVRAIRAFHPETVVMTRARDLAAADRLTAAGANATFHETMEMSVALGAAVLRRLGQPEDAVDDAVETLRRDDFALLRDARARMKLPDRDLAS